METNVDIEMKPIREEEKPWQLSLIKRNARGVEHAWKVVQ
jgi:hypothetical protein